MDWACSMRTEMRNIYKIIVGNFGRKRSLAKPRLRDLERKITLKWK
jgi:hypothetical protein